MGTLKGVGSIVLGDKIRKRKEVDLCESNEMTLGHDQKSGTDRKVSGEEKSHGRCCDGSCGNIVKFIICPFHLVSNTS